MIQSVIDRLKTETTALHQVESAIQFAAVKGLPRTPAAYVIPISDSAQPNDRLNIVAQEVQVRVGIVAVVSNLSDRTGGAAAIDLEPVRGQVRDALLGWEPGVYFGPLEFRRGNLVGTAHGGIWWLDQYETPYSIRETT